MNSKLGKNIILNVGYNVLSIVVPLITAPYIGRVLGAENVGIYTYIYSISSYFVMFGLLGISNYGTREIAKVRDNAAILSKTFCDIYAMQIISGITAAVVYILYMITFAKNYTIYGWVMTFYVLTSTFDISWFFSGIENFQGIVLRNIAVKIVNLIAIFAFVRKKEDLFRYVLIMAVCYLLNSLLLWPSMLKRVKIVKPEIKNIKNHFKPNILLFVPAIAASVYQIMDKIMIGGLAETTQLAYYEYADKILNIPNIVFGAIGAVMLSRVSHELNNSETKVQKMIGYSMDLSFIVSAASVFGLEAISTELVSVYYGKEFMKSADVLYILAPVVFLYGWNSVLRMQYVIPKQKDKIYISSTFAGAIINLIFNFCFIPRFGAIGATIGTISAQLVILVIFYKKIKSELPLQEYIRNNIPIIVNGIVMFLIVKIVSKTHSATVKGLFLDVIIGVFSFFVGGILIGYNNPKHLIGTIIRKERIVK